MTAPYARELVTKLGKLLAEYDAERGAAPAFDDIKLERTPQNGIKFTLYARGEKAASGVVTEAVARKARAFLGEMFDPPKVVRMTQRATFLMGLFLTSNGMGLAG